MEESFSQSEYKKHKKDVERKLRLKVKTTYDYLEAYKMAIMLEEYELAKAISECLADRNVDVKETHPYIETIN